MTSRRQRTAQQRSQATEMTAGSQTPSEHCSGVLSVFEVELQRLIFTSRDHTEGQRADALCRLRKGMEPKDFQDLCKDEMRKAMDELLEDFDLDERDALTCEQRVGKFERALELHTLADHLVKQGLPDSRRTRSPEERRQMLYEAWVSRGPQTINAYGVNASSEAVEVPSTFETLASMSAQLRALNQHQEESERLREGLRRQVAGGEKKQDPK